MEQLPRIARLYSKTYFNYNISVAIASWGDAFTFVDGKEKRGIVIADTLGHVKKIGDRMQLFLEEEVVNGWGEEDNARKALIELSKRLSKAKGRDLIDLGKRLLEGKIYADQIPEISQMWCDHVSVSYTQLSDQGLTFSNAGTNSAIHITNNSFQEIFSKECILDAAYDKLDFCYHTELLLGETFLIYSDGFIDNMILRIAEANRMLGGERLGESIREKVCGIIADKVRKYETASEIRDNLIQTPFGELILPLATPYYKGGDDVTFAVIKRKP